MTSYRAVFGDHTWTFRQQSMADAVEQCDDYLRSTVRDQLGWPPHAMAFRYELYEVRGEFVSEYGFDKEWTGKYAGTPRVDRTVVLEPEEPWCPGAGGGHGWVRTGTPYAPFERLECSICGAFRIRIFGSGVPGTQTAYLPPRRVRRGPVEARAA